MRAFVLLSGLIVLAGSAHAGTADAPEVSDAADDCSYAAGNHYADILAAWISDETVGDFRVNIRLSEWAADAAGSFAGYTLQFTHQHVQWGVAALYEPANGWDFSTGFIDIETGEMRDFNSTEGTWDATSATMSILFPKILFPHNTPDNKLSAFVGGSADLKKDVPVYVAQELGAPVEPAGGMLVCDLVRSELAYTFSTGEHAMHESTPPTAEPTITTPTEQAPADAPAAMNTPAPRDTPGAPLGLLLVLLACLGAFQRAK